MEIDEETQGDSDVPEDQLVNEEEENEQPVKRLRGRPVLEKTEKPGRPKKIYKLARNTHDESYQEPTTVKQAMESNKKSQ